MEIISSTAFNGNSNRKLITFVCRSIKAKVENISEDDMANGSL